MRNWVSAAAAAFCAVLIGAAPASACGVDSDCRIMSPDGGARSYRIYLPEGVEAPMGAILYAHGYRGSAAGAMRNAALLRLADKLGVAFIAANADDHDDWVLPGAPSDPGYRGRRELDYFRALMADAKTRFGVDAERTMATGFSAGGMMIWNLICDESDLVAAYAPVAGVFWDPIPADCAGPAASVIHFHGRDDRIVPMTGRPIGRTRQGGVRAAVALYAGYGAFGAVEPVVWDELSCERRVNAEGRVLELCLFAGGHSFKSSYVERAWRRFEALGALSVD